MYHELSTNRTMIIDRFVSEHMHGRSIPKSRNRRSRNSVLPYNWKISCTIQEPSAI